MKKIIFILNLFLICDNISAQSKKLTAAILSMDARGVSFDDKQMGSLLRLELEKLDTFQVVDRYDINYFMEKKTKQIFDSLYKSFYSGNPRKADSCYKKVYFEVQQNFEYCFSKSCLV